MAAKRHANRKPPVKKKLTVRSAKKPETTRVKVTTPTGRVRMMDLTAAQLEKLGKGHLHKKRGRQPRRGFTEEGKRRLGVKE